MNKWIKTVILLSWSVVPLLFAAVIFFLKHFQVLVMEMNNFYFKFLYRCNIYGISL